MIYHVSKKGNDKNNGSEQAPFLTIQKAADVMIPGDKVIVHEGIYREWVKPREGGKNENTRITYEAAKGEKVIIKGSEIVKNWKLYKGTTWVCEIDNSLFGSYNPFDTPIIGDWMNCPRDIPVHTGEVYINGRSLYECSSLDEVIEGKPFKKVVNCFRFYFEEKFKHPELTAYKWFSKVSDNVTTVYANFHEFDPNKEETEINVRLSCFFPERTGLDYITVRGFEIAQCASKWAPPTSDQTGIIGPHWAKKWIIENNIIHDAKCSAVCIGKEISTGNEERSKYGKIPGYQSQMESVFKAYDSGWSFENIGSHIIRNNIIYDCGQNGVVGNLGGVSSEIYNNEIYNS